MATEHDILAQTFTAIRENAGLTKAQLCKATGLAPMTVRKLEQGKLDPRWSTLVMFARGCGVELQILPGEHLLP